MYSGFSLCPLLLSGRELIFFFQAKDGIRDLTVTGVQTCALPILLAIIAYLICVGACIKVLLPHGLVFSFRGLCAHAGRSRGGGRRARGRPGSGHGLDRRSEERRVGKDGGSRWRAYCRVGNRSESE